MRNSPCFFVLVVCLFIITSYNGIQAQWLSTDIFPSANQGVFSLAASGQNFFAGTHNGGVFLTTNNGGSWNEVNSGLTNDSVSTLAVMGSNVFAGTYGGGVFLTTNSGTNWTDVNSGLTSTEIYSFAVSGSNIFTGTNEGVFLTVNNGTNWTKMSSGLPNSSVRALAVSESNLYAAVLFSVYLSTNNGTSWTEINSGLPSNTTIYSLVVSDSNIFAGTDGGGVYLSTNNGTSWTEANSGLTNDVVWTFAVFGSNIFAGTDDGVFLSANNGSSWVSTDYNLTSAYALAVSETYLFAGGGFGRVARRPLSELTDVKDEQNIIPVVYKLNQNYPNPFNPSTLINYQIPEEGLVSLKVYDILGNEVKTLVNEIKTIGSFNVQLDAGNLSSGVYFYKLTVGNFVSTQKMILLK
jgi:photosystem II stability/assembly factor-like uncharacterized protein